MRAAALMSRISVWFGHLLHVGKVMLWLLSKQVALLIHAAWTYGLMLLLLCSFGHFEFLTEIIIEQVDEFKYLGILTHGTKGLSPALELLCKAAKRAMFGLQRRCQQLNIQDPVLKCKLFDTLVRPILCYCCEVWSVLGSKSDLKDLERVQLGFLKALLGVQTSTKCLHVYAEFERYPLHIVWQSQAAKYLRRLEAMSPDRILTQASIADCRLPDKLSWHHRLNHQLQDFLKPTPTADDPLLQSFSLQSARSAFVEAIQTDTSSKALVYRGIKEGYQCEPYIQTSRNRHLRSIVA